MMTLTADTPPVRPTETVKGRPRPDAAPGRVTLDDTPPAPTTGPARPATAAPATVEAAEAAGAPGTITTESATTRPPPSAIRRTTTVLDEKVKVPRLA